MLKISPESPPKIKNEIEDKVKTLEEGDFIEMTNRELADYYYGKNPEKLKKVLSRHTQEYWDTPFYVNAKKPLPDELLGITLRSGFEDPAPFDALGHLGTLEWEERHNYPITVNSPGGKEPPLILLHPELTYANRGESDLKDISNTLPEVLLHESAHAGNRQSKREKVWERDNSPVVNKYSELSEKLIGHSMGLEPYKVPPKEVRDLTIQPTSNDFGGHVLDTEEVDSEWKAFMTMKEVIPENKEEFQSYFNQLDKEIPHNDPKFWYIRGIMDLAKNNKGIMKLLENISLKAEE